MRISALGRKAVAVIAVGLLGALLAAPAAAAAGPAWSHRDARLCGAGGAGDATCFGVVRTLYRDGAAIRAANVTELANDVHADANVSYTAVGVRTAYGITGQGDPSRVIAIVDAYDDTGAYANLTTYRAAMGLPAISSCTLSAVTALTSSSASPCFAKVNQTGGTSLPVANSGWANEEDLDLQAASAVCPKCSIVLFEASSASFANLGTAVTTASNTAHVLAISNSYGSTGDAPGASYPQWDNAAKKGIAVMASAGDNGYGASFPASATDVIGVGGTTLAVGASGARTAETVWSGTGSGCSSYNAAPSWQVIAGSPCDAYKAISDLSADADPASGMQVYTTYGGTTGWYVFGGTSLSSPLVAALYAMQGGYDASTLAGAHAWAAGTPYFDVTSGNNGSCSPTVVCTAGAGWDGPTGRGSISLVAPVLTSVAIAPSSTTVEVGATAQFTARALDQNGNPMAVQPSFTWTAGGTAGSVNAVSGLYSATSSGGDTVTATDPVSGLWATATVTVSASQILKSITVSPTSASVNVGSTRLYGATAYDQLGVAMAVQPAITWTVSGGGTISAAGLFTATTAGGPFTVTASSGGVSGTASVTVTKPDFTIAVSPASQSVKRGSSTTFTVTITRLNGFSGAVSLSLTGAPSGATVTFTPGSVTGTTATVKITTRSTTSVRAYTLTVKGTNGSLSHTATATLNVTR